MANKDVHSAKRFGGVPSTKLYVKVSGSTSGGGSSSTSSYLWGNLIFNKYNLISTRNTTGSLTTYPSANTLSWYAMGEPSLTCRVEVIKEYSTLKTFDSCSGEKLLSFPKPEVGENSYPVQIKFTFSSGSETKTLTMNVEVLKPREKDPNDVGSYDVYDGRPPREIGGGDSQ